MTDSELDIVPAGILPGQDAIDFSALGASIARAQAEGAAVTVVYAPASVTHHHHAAPAPTGSTGPAVRPRPSGAGHPGIDVDLTGYGGAFTVPADPGPLPAVAERREWAPLVMLVSCWSGLGALFVTILTSSPFAIAYVFLALVVNAVAFAANYRNGQGA